MEPQVGHIIKVEGYDMLIIAEAGDYWLVIPTHKVYPANVLAVPRKTSK